MSLAGNAITTSSGLVIGSMGDDAYLGANGVEGMGHGRHRMPMTDAINGGQHGGRAVPGAAVIEVDAWASDPVKALALRSEMGAIEDPADEVPLAWSGLGWPTGEYCWFVRPSGFDRDADEDAVPDSVGEAAIGMRLQWVAADPTVYRYSPTVVASGTASLVSLPVTNPGVATRAGRAWTLRLTAGPGGCSQPRIHVGSRSVGWAGLSMPPGSVLVVDRHRHSWLEGGVTVGVDAAVRSGGSRFADWPVLPSGSSAFVATCTSGSLSAELTYRATW